MNGSTASILISVMRACAPPAANSNASAKIAEKAVFMVHLPMRWLA